MRPILSGTGRSPVETLLAAAFISVFLLAALSRYSSSVKSVKETALSVELSNLRTAVSYYVMVNKRLPGSIKDLMRYSSSNNEIQGQDYRVVILGKFVESMTLDKDGLPLDPFGNIYYYDNVTGRVSSPTKGYEGW